MTINDLEDGLYQWKIVRIEIIDDEDNGGTEVIEPSNAPEEVLLG